MPLEKITERIIEDAREAADRVLRKGEEDAQRVRVRYKKKAKGFEERAMKEAEALAEAKRSQMIHTAQRLARNQILALKQDWIDRVFSEVKRDVLEMPKREYLTFLVNLVKKANLEGNEEIGLAHRDLALRKRLDNELRQEFPGCHFMLLESPFPIEAGIVVKKGQMFLNASIDAVLNELRGQMEREIVDILFSSEGKADGV